MYKNLLYVYEMPMSHTFFGKIIPYTVKLLNFSLDIKLIKYLSPNKKGSLEPSIVSHHSYPMHLDLLLSIFCIFPLNAWCLYILDLTFPNVHKLVSWNPYEFGWQVQWGMQSHFSCVLRKHEWAMIFPYVCCYLERLMFVFPDAL